MEKDDGCWGATTLSSAATLQVQLLTSACAVRPSMCGIGGVLVRAKTNERTNGGRAGEGETSHSKGGFQSKASFSRSAIRSRRRPIRRVPRPVSFRNCSPYSVDTLDSNSQLDIHVYRSRRRPTSRHQHRLVSSNGRG